MVQKLKNPGGLGFFLKKPGFFPALLTWQTKLSLSRAFVIMIQIPVPEDLKLYILSVLERVFPDNISPDVTVALQLNFYRGDILSYRLPYYLLIS